MELKECPKCGNKKVWQVFKAAKNKWHCECFKCHHCGHACRLRAVARILWNIYRK